MRKLYPKFRTEAGQEQESEIGGKPTKLEQVLVQNEKDQKRMGMG